MKYIVLVSVILRAGCANWSERTAGIRSHWHHASHKASKLAVVPVPPAAPVQSPAVVAPTPAPKAAEKSAWRRWGDRAKGLIFRGPAQK